MTGGLTAMAVALAFAWGATGHRIINTNAVMHLPTIIGRLKADSLFYGTHASDADIRRRSSDTSFYGEPPRHFIDIDDYPDFHNLPRNLDTLIGRYGWDRVKKNGINPWVTKWLVDSLTLQIARGDSMVKQTMSDLGHYVGDAHQPLHCTANYDGQFTNNRGIHSRYESSMINAYQDQITIHPDSVHFISTPLDYAFDYIYRSNSYVDSVMAADNAAKQASGWTGSGTPPASYYSVLWERTGTFTIDLIQSATVDLASLWYTAYVNAMGLNQVDGSGMRGLPEKFELDQNYPNPFNPSTEIRFRLRKSGNVIATVYDLQGREVSSLVNGRFEAGLHEIPWTPSGIAGGAYILKMEAGGSVQVRKLLLIK